MAGSAERDRGPVLGLTGGHESVAHRGASVTNLTRSRPQPSAHIAGRRDTAVRLISSYCQRATRTRWSSVLCGCSVDDSVDALWSSVFCQSKCSELMVYDINTFNCLLYLLRSQTGSCYSKVMDYVPQGFLWSSRQDVSTLRVWLGRWCLQSALQNLCFPKSYCNKLSTTGAHCVGTSLPDFHLARLRHFILSPLAKINQNRKNTLLHKHKFATHP